ncbi:MAG: 23S rRNA (uracil(1939)-C(5))-methyltransferase RlmD [Polaromonas sp.]|jgi:23S rRNA (uracil1939-C5)-methyltransferase|nr:23S rRNA (uracil(1939)-C(5))-methyltransferase RlmD [Polaromonas sp.]MBP6155446.1 23S rRNA (uracil(1939)-C(5))-methyltransferase RlmD [Polaromonas sp.]MBP7114918.1 23S rRNA (uracil(1939)-C(5))-methyltransferase RlmD [Polaromonas sp.]MBP8874072.1 23S rRNA (uracil(1939)-C(5))-methyltransferase RlmD [Polaromonas sp.]MBP9831595.1 23S rRNA (uracil(1939)-C(5))-methyltransferase RlmD [Polaromonas sp.]
MRKNRSKNKTENLTEASETKTYPTEWLYVESLDIEAQGVAHKADGKVVFIDGALPFEVVSANVNRKKDNWEKATLLTVKRESSQRVTPNCPHFGLHSGACGGCKMQHLHIGAQVAVKQRALEDGLWHLGKIKANNILRPIEGPAWGYRYRARISVKFVRKKGEHGQVLIGFHERKSRYVADMQVCPVLPQHVSDLLMPLRDLIASMDAKETIPQLEIAVGDAVVAMVVRHMEALSTNDMDKLRDFALKYTFVQWWLQPKGLDTVHLMDEQAGKVSTLSYALPQFGITMPFKPTDFTQVNPHINQVLVSRALRLLDVQKSERVIDWFCGLGNFTLPLATQAKEVLGVEGSEELVSRSRQNYLFNQPKFLKNKPVAAVSTAYSATEFVVRNLFEITGSVLAEDGIAEKWLMDPPREGAFALVKALVELVTQDSNPTIENPSEAVKNWQPPKRIVYVSCNPATLARDAGLLVNEAGYTCTAAGVVNMFPHTAHVESMAVFERL